MRLALVTSLFASLLTVHTAAAAGPDDQSAFAARVVDLTNAERARAGLPALSPNPDLADAAQSYSDVLATSGCFTHTCGDVPDFADRDATAGYTGWTSLGENIATGYPTPEAVVAGWMASPGHRANILSPSFTEIGIGLAANSGQYGTFWTEEFGARGD